MLTEIILGEHTPVTDASIQYSIVNEGFRATIKGEAVFEPVAPLRERFAKLKARDNLLGAVLARLGLKVSDADQAPEVVGRMLEDRMGSATWADTFTSAMSKIAKGLGLRDGGAMMKPDELAAQVLAMNTEITSALAKAQERITELENQAAGDSAAAFHDLCLAQDEIAKLRAEVEQECGYKLHAWTGLDAAHSRSAELEAEVRILKHSLEVRELERVLACARVSGLAAELQEVERAMREKLRP